MKLNFCIRNSIDLNSQIRSTDSLREKYNNFLKLEEESLNNKVKKLNKKKSFKEIMENINYVYDNIDKYFNVNIKKNKKGNKKKNQKIIEEN